MIEAANSKGRQQKFALLTYSTLNLGDDIQSFAARQYFPGVDLRIDRDALSSAPAQWDGGEAKIILNGWHTHAPERWPPAPFLTPLLVSCHVTRQVAFENLGGLRSDLFLTRGESLRYLRDHGPVGARDAWTQDLFREHEIPVWFSGCLTLTFGSRRNPSRQDYVCAVDLPLAALRRLRSATSRQVVIATHQVGRDAGYGERAYLAQRLLSLYAHAHCVVTTRLHCALPCLALGVPVLFLKQAKDAYRFSGLDSLLRCGSVGDYLEGRIAFEVDDPQPNAEDFLPLRRELVLRASQFTGEAALGPDTPPFPFEPTPFAKIPMSSMPPHDLPTPLRADRTELQAIPVEGLRKIFPAGRDYQRDGKADFLRDVGRLFAETGDMLAAARLMRIALAERPHGAWIAELMKAYEDSPGGGAPAPPAPVYANAPTVLSALVERNFTTLSPRRLESLARELARVDVRAVVGDFVEFGVGAGGSGIVIAGRLAGARRYFGFDLFAPPTLPTQSDAYEQVVANFAEHGLAVDGRSIVLARGRFAATLGDYAHLIIAAALVDCDDEDALRACLDYVQPRLSRFGSIVVEPTQDTLAWRTVLDEFCARAPDLVLVATEPHAILVRA